MIVHSYVVGKEVNYATNLQGGLDPSRAERLESTTLMKNAHVTTTL